MVCSAVGVATFSAGVACSPVLDVPWLEPCLPDGVSSRFDVAGVRLAFDCHLSLSTAPLSWLDLTELASWLPLLLGRGLPTGVSRVWLLRAAWLVVARWTVSGLPYCWGRVCQPVLYAFGLLLRAVWLVVA